MEITQPLLWFGLIGEIDIQATLDASSSFSSQQQWEIPSIVYIPVQHIGAEHQHAVVE